LITRRIGTGVQKDMQIRLCQNRRARVECSS
jgi:hypothetical protein